jgi:hypothetical protein
VIPIPSSTFISSKSIMSHLLNSQNFSSHWWMIFSNVFINFNFKSFNPQMELNSWLFARSTRFDRVSWLK